MKIELGYNAGISVYNNYKNETTLEIEDINFYQCFNFNDFGGLWG